MSCTTVVSHSPILQAALVTSKTLTVPSAPALAKRPSRIQQQPCAPPGKALLMAMDFMGRTVDQTYTLVSSEALTAWLPSGEKSMALMRAV